MPDGRAMPGMQGEAVEKPALWFYLLPLGLLLLSTLLASLMTASEQWPAFSVLMGLLAGFVLLPAALRISSTYIRCIPVVAEAESPESSLESSHES